MWWKVMEDIQKTDGTARDKINKKCFKYTVYGKNSKLDTEEEMTHELENVAI